MCESNSNSTIGWMSCIHYKFRNNSKHDTIQFDGSYITVGEIKQAILGQKKMGKAPDFTLQIINAQTQEGKSHLFYRADCANIVICLSYCHQ